MIKWQVQKSHDGVDWVAMQPVGHGLPSMVTGEHWFTARVEAHLAARRLRNVLTFDEVRVVRKEGDGQIADEGVVL